MEAELKQTDNAVDNFGKEEQQADTKTDKLGNSIQRAKGKAETFERGIKSLSGSLKNGLSASTVAAGQLLANFATAAVRQIKNVVATGLTYNQQIESYSTNFGVLLGDMEAGVAKVEELKKFAASTPFDLGTLSDATQTLLSFQVPADKTNTILKQLGDIALGDKNKLSGLAVVFGQVSSAGKLQGQDLMQMINQGFNPLNFIAKRTGESMEELRDRMSQGKITAEEVTQAIADATSEGAMFYDGMSQASKTLSGLLSTLKDDATALLGQVLTPITNWLKESLVPQTQEYVKTLMTALTDGSVSTKDAIGGILEDIIGKVSDTMESVLPKISGFFSDMLDVLIEALPSLVENGRNMITNLFNGMSEIIPKIAEFAGGIAPLIIETIIKWKSFIFESGFEILTEILKGIAAEPERLTSTIKDTVTSIINTLSDNAADLLDAGIDIIIAIAQGIIDAINAPEFPKKVNQIITSIITKLEDKWPEIQRAGVALTKALFRGMMSIIDSLAMNFTVKLMNAITGDNLSAKEATTLRNAYFEKYGNAPLFASGKDYVPYDNFSAVLHEGEAVLTKPEATLWREGAKGGASIDYERLGQAVAASMPGTEINLYVDGKKMGRGLAKHVSEAMGKGVVQMIRSGVNADISASIPV